MNLDWPAKEGQRDVPDKTKKLGTTTGPTVWETWKTANGIISPEAWCATHKPNAVTSSFLEMRIPPLD